MNNNFHGIKAINCVKAMIFCRLFNGILVKLINQTIFHGTPVLTRGITAAEQLKITSLKQSASFSPPFINILYG